MNVKLIKLRHFRNYEELNLTFNSHVNLLIGSNGQGKTNLLEAIELALTGESFRSNINQEFVNFNSTYHSALIQLKVEKKDGEREIEIRILDGKRDVLINSKKVSKETLRSHFAAVTFSPESLMTIKQGPNERRQLIDQLLISINKENSKKISEYQRCLRSRNKVLKDAFKGEISPSDAEPLLQSVDALFLPLAVNLTIARLEAIKYLEPRVKKALVSILKSNTVDISVDYVISEKSAIDWSQNQVYDVLLTRMKELHKAELSSGQSLVGPHRHDVRFNFNGRDSRYYCSQGQQRAIILAVKVAHIFVHNEIHGEFPVLLLDDVFSELDLEKRQALLSILSDLPAQIILTTTEVDRKGLFQNKEVTVFQVENGNVKTGWN